MGEFYTHGELAAACLTGRRRHRVSWRGKLILQVEIKHPHPHYPRAPRPGPYDPWANGYFRFWRDATTADLAEFSLCDGEAGTKPGQSSAVTI